MDSLIVTDAAQREFEDLKRLRNRAVFFKLEQTGNQFELQHATSVSMEDTHHEDIFSHFPADQCGYVLFNLEYMEGRGRRVKSFFALWVPEGVTTKQKMIYAGWALIFKKKMSLPTVPLQVSHTVEMEYEQLVSMCKERYD